MNPAQNLVRVSRYDAETTFVGKVLGMAVNTEYRDYVLDLLEPMGEVSAQRFFGGIGIRQGSTQFGVIMNSTLYFCVDDLTREKYIEMGSAPFSYTKKKGHVVVKRYYEVPEAVLENSDELWLWAEEAVATAARG